MSRWCKDGPFPYTIVYPRLKKSYTTILSYDNRKPIIICKSPQSPSSGSDFSGFDAKQHVPSKCPPTYRQLSHHPHVPESGIDEPDNSGRIRTFTHAARELCPINHSSISPIFHHHALFSVVHTAAAPAINR